VLAGTADGAGREYDGLQPQHDRRRRGADRGEQQGGDQHAVVTQAANRGPRTSTWPGFEVGTAELLSCDMSRAFCCCRMAGVSTPEGCPMSDAEEGANDSAATTTTATTRNAAQIHCAALGERELEAG
jgi:hypothetical protein